MTTTISRPRRLTDYLAQPPAPFAWAAANCCHWAAAWVAQATGTDPMAGLPETATAAAARRLVKRLGGSLRAAWSKQLGREPIAPLLAQLGDIVLVQLPPEQQLEEGVGELVGICAGALIAVATAQGHVAYLPLSAGVCAWRLEVQA
ncbi:DUF6950 family protein [Roseateles cavernae]|uniref:DUF6950 family protein n=1 Tax=Roseateles cavernae TaxID=3153578 RepID=UPI0032E41F42